MKLIRGSGWGELLAGYHGDKCQTGLNSLATHETIVTEDLVLFFLLVSNNSQP